MKKIYWKTKDAVADAGLYVFGLIVFHIVREDRPKVRK